MVITGTWRGRAITISVKPNCLTVSVAGDRGADVFSYDYEGRLWTAMLDEVSYRRGLDGKMVAKWQHPDRSRDRRWLYPEEAATIETAARERLAALQADMAAGAAELSTPLPEQALFGFAQAEAFDTARATADITRYHEVYKPVGILPPDQYFAVVLQATEGCSFNTCTFCTFYKDRPFRIKKPDEFATHARAVRDYLGQGLSLRRTIFLGDANALVVPMPRLLPLFDAVHQTYDVEALGGIYAFLDGFSGDKKSPGDYRQLAERGLKMVYVGLESGSEKLLKFLNKPGKPKDMINAVRAMKKGGVAVGVIVLLGAGGHAYSKAHVNDTIKTINAMDLDMDDLIYFSELVTSEDMAYTQAAYQQALQPLTAEERLAQAAAIERELRFSRRGGMPHISRYDVREFVY